MKRLYYKPFTIGLPYGGSGDFWSIGEWRTAFALVYVDTGAPHEDYKIGVAVLKDGGVDARATVDSWGVIAITANRELAADALRLRQNRTATCRAARHRRTDEALARQDRDVP